MNFLGTEFKTALAANGLKHFMKEDASVQPGKLSDLLLHETAVAWVRKWEGQTLPKHPWKESTESFASRLKEIVAKINKKHNVEGLCMGLPKRVTALHSKQGKKLRK